MSATGRSSWSGAATGRGPDAATPKRRTERPTPSHPGRTPGRTSHKRRRFDVNDDDVVFEILTRYRPWIAPKKELRSCKCSEVDAYGRRCIGWCGPDCEGRMP